MPLQSSLNFVDRLNDTVLGIFANVPESEKLNCTVRLLNTWNGSDKLFMVVQYVAKLLVPILKHRTIMRHRAGLVTSSKSAVAEKMAIISSIISDSRILWRIWGILPILQWMISLERSSSSRLLRTIERLQGFSMLVYYPLEHICYLSAHRILPSRFTPSDDLNNKLSIWSCRAWAAYVLLQLWHLKEDYRMLELQEDSFKKRAKSGVNLGPIPSEEALAISRRKAALWNELVVNFSYLPLTLHWSLKNGLFKNEVLEGLFGVIAALFSVRSGWAASSLPNPTF